MNRRPKVLWIEDSARLELASLTAPLFFNNTCDLSLAEDVTSAVHHLLSDWYDALVVDIRLPPGRDREWSGHYLRAGSSKVSAQLGLKLLYWLIHRDTSIYSREPPDWIDPQRIAIFTVETYREVKQDLERLRISVFQEKTASIPDDVLDGLIRTLLGRGNGAPGQGRV